VILLDLDFDLDSIINEYVKITAKEFTESFEKFLTITKSEDILITVLRGHLYVEHELENLLSKYIFNLDKLNNKYYKQKLDMALGLGIVKKELFDGLKFLNELRNKFVHDLNFEFSEAEYIKFENKLGTELQAEISEMVKDETKVSEKVRAIIAKLWSELKINTMDIYLKSEYASRINLEVLKDVEYYLEKHAEVIGSETE
jgi:DNA-binding MltR family transcriptional regulator